MTFRPGTSEAPAAWTSVAPVMAPPEKVPEPPGSNWEGVELYLMDMRGPRFNSEAM